jgi:hypothetical protein
MAYIKEHCRECVEKLGKPFEEVHKWLDAYAEKYPVKIFNEYHRGYRHNKYGIEKIREMWGDDAVKAAELHILTDYGYIPYWKAFPEEDDMK